jgi:hypothetical protein
MARTGKFGRSPRVASSITNTLVAIARQFQQQEDQNIVSAWQKGGTYEGQKVTDAMLIQHWKDRAQGVSKDDPMYDNYQQAVTQLEYSIGESKMTAAYSQGKATDAQMIAFFTKSEKSIPKDSEFYRVLQRDAGQYMSNAKAKAQSGRTAAVEAQYAKDSNALKAKNEAAGTFLTDTITRLAQTGNSRIGVGQLIAGAGSGSGLQDFDVNDPSQLARLIGLITPQTNSGANLSGSTSATFTPSTNVLYYDDSGKPVTGATIYAQVQKLIPGFSGPITNQTIVDATAKQIAGLDQRIALANKTGHFTDAANLTNQKTQVAALQRLQQTAPAQALYMTANKTYEATLNDKKSSPQQIVNAWTAYKGALGGILQMPGIQHDTAYMNMITNEMNGVAGPTAADTFTGLSSGDFNNDPASSPAAKAQIRIQEAQAALDQVKTDPNSHYTVGNYIDNGDGTHTFVADPNGKTIGVASEDQIKGAGLNPVVMWSADPNGAGSIPITVTGVPVTADATNTNGVGVAGSNQNPVATAYSFPGDSSPLFAKNLPGGGVTYSYAPPGGANNSNIAGMSQDGSGFHIHLAANQVPDTTGLDMSKNSTTGDIPGHPGWTIQGAVIDASGKVTTMGHLVMDPTVTVHAADPSGSLSGGGGINPNTDFASPTLARLMHSPDAQATLATLTSNPSFKAQVMAEVAASAGGSLDPTTGKFTGGNQALFDQFDQQTTNIVDGNIMSGANTSSYTDKASQLWMRQNTNPTYQGAVNPTPTNGQLPSNTLGGSFILGGLGSVWMPNGQFAPPAGKDGSGTVITKDAPIYLPSVAPGMTGLRGGFGNNLTLSNPGAVTLDQSHYTPPSIQEYVNSAAPQSVTTTSSTGTVAPQGGNDTLDQGGGGSGGGYGPKKN